MKSYYAPNQLCLVGKAWEVQYYLRKLTAGNHMMKQPLAAVINEKAKSYLIHKPNPFSLVSAKEV
jgi:hypothetical protein